MKNFKWSPETLINTETPMKVVETLNSDDFIKIELNREIREIKNSIFNLNLMDKKKNDLIRNLEENVLYQEEQINYLTNNIQHKEKEIQQKEKEILQKENLIKENELKSKLIEKKLEIETNKINNLMNSKSWKLTKPFRKLKSILNKNKKKDI